MVIVYDRIKLQGGCTSFRCYTLLRCSVLYDFSHTERSFSDDDRYFI